MEKLPEKCKCLKDRIGIKHPSYSSNEEAVAGGLAIGEIFYLTGTKVKYIVYPVNSGVEIKYGKRF